MAPDADCLCTLSSSILILLHVVNLRASPLLPTTAAITYSSIVGAMFATFTTHPGPSARSTRSSASRLTRRLLSLPACQAIVANPEYFNKNKGLKRLKESLL